jgi:hypothetical protein
MFKYMLQLNLVLNVRVEEIKVWFFDKNLINKLVKFCHKWILVSI